ncbi:hypothetical protein [Clostridium gasigenes]|uniref:Polysaccharide deacetylase n=1 Tax=Clostridium gasigenes TaxID=94869 RepID=A0A7X0S9E0_9CLOT|nr:hypothetical protein [Clostridium gasigenes]MBB6713481.1 hypothetical protein [Clostridium gasigenes]
MKCDFSFEHYNEIITKIKEAGYKSSFLKEKINGKQIIIRHDVDLDLDAALEMAKIEADMGMIACYFIWINAPFYNIFEQRYTKIINEIISLGHEVGLHFDETCHECKTIDDMLFCIDKECEFLNDHLDIKIESVSFHRPTERILNSDLKLGKYINTYSQKFFKQFKYISDSKGLWKEDCMCKMLDNIENEKIQFLTHPIWWKEKSLNNQDRLKEFLEFKLKKMNDEISENIKSYHKKDFKITE